MRSIAYLFFAIALVVFIADLINVAFLKDFMPSVDDRWQPTISLVSLTIGIALYKIDKLKRNTS